MELKCLILQIKKIKNVKKIIIFYFKNQIKMFNFTK